MHEIYRLVHCPSACVLLCRICVMWWADDRYHRWRSANFDHFELESRRCEHTTAATRRRGRIFCCFDHQVDRVVAKASRGAVQIPYARGDYDDELVVNPPTPCEICKHPPVLNKNGRPARGAHGGGNSLCSGPSTTSVASSSTIGAIALCGSPGGPIVPLYVE